MMCRAIVAVLAALLGVACTPVRMPSGHAPTSSANPLGAEADDGAHVLYLIDALQRHVAALRLAAYGPDDGEDELAS